MNYKICYGDLKWQNGVVPFVVGHVLESFQIILQKNVRDVRLRDQDSSKLNKSSCDHIDR